MRAVERGLRCTEKCPIGINVMLQRRKQFWRWVGPLVWLATMALSAAESRADAPSREFQLKAACLVNFVQFVEWPESALGAVDAPFVITVLGDNPFGTVLEKLARNKVIRGRAVVVKFAQTLDQVGPTHLLFVAPPADRGAAQVVKHLAGKNVLSVSDAEDFNRAGGCIRLFLEENRMRFEINLSVATRAGLKPTAKMLQLARIFKED